MGSSVQFEGVSKRYGDNVVLRDFDLEVVGGEFVTLLGPSGSGKTTALNILAGFSDLTTGDVRIGDRSIISLPPEKRNVGMVFQGFSLFPHMTVFENVAFPLRMRKVASGEIRRRVQNALEMVRMEDFASRRPDKLSGGQRQRVALARAVVFEPEVLLMDECLSALDLRLRETLQQEIRALHTELKNTVIFVTHDQKEALSLSNRVAVMQNGTIQQIGTPSEIYGQPKNRFVAEFIGDATWLNVIPTGDGAGYLKGVDATIPYTEQCDGYLMLRPEHVKRECNGTPRDDEDSVRFEATITDSAFLGGFQSYLAKSSGGETIKFQESRGEKMLAIGERVQLRFLIKDATVITDNY